VAARGDGAKTHLPGLVASAIAIVVLLGIAVADHRPRSLKVLGWVGILAVAAFGYCLERTLKEAKAAWEATDQVAQGFIAGVPALLALGVPIGWWTLRHGAANPDTAVAVCTVWLVAAIIGVGLFDRIVGDAVALSLSSGGLSRRAATPSTMPALAEYLARTLGGTARRRGELLQVQGRRRDRDVGVIFGRDGRLTFQVRAASDPPERLDLSAATMAAHVLRSGERSPGDAALADLFGAHRCRRLRTLGRLFEAETALPRDASFDEALGALDGLITFADGPGRSGPQISVSAPAGVATCPYCRDDIDDATASSCGRCGTPHHAACLEEAGGCTVLGCAGRQRRVRA
jgi:hypothetical protein